MSDQPHTSANLFGRTATIAAPLALLIGSTCYFAGTIYQKRLLSEYGFGGGTIQSSLQAVIAQGYMAVLASIVFATIPTFVGMAIAMSFRRGRSVVHISGRAIMRPRNFAQLGIWIYLAFAMAGLGYIFGEFGRLANYLVDKFTDSRPLQNLLPLQDLTRAGCGAPSCSGRAGHSTCYTSRIRVAARRVNQSCTPYLYGRKVLPFPFGTELSQLRGVGSG
jgi:hypothetical protein